MRYQFAAVSMAPSRLQIVCLAILLCFSKFVYSLKTEDDTFQEELLIKPLPSGHVYVYFQFPIRWKVNLDHSNSLKHFRLFPRSLGQIVAKHGVQELHLSLTQGHWKHKKWGYPLRNAPAGAELWTWFRSETVDISKAWAELTNALSGQFCASLNFIDATSTISPRYSFRPQGVVDYEFGANMSHIRYAVLPRETVCTENLSPWRKLLPCDTKAGLSTLLNAIQILNSNYFSIAVDFQLICQNRECTRTALELLFSVSVVFNPPVSQQGKQDWSFVKLFGAALPTSCPLAEKSNVYIDISANETGVPFTLTPSPTEVTEIHKGIDIHMYAVYNLKNFLQNSSHINIAANYKKEHIYWPATLPSIHATRFITGYGVERGGIQCHIYNAHPTKTLKIIYLEIIPWFLRFYSHTLRVTTEGKPILKEYQYYQPGRDREQPHHLELVFTLLPKSVTKVSFEFDRAFLKWTEYPPDANHGFYVGSSVISTILQSSSNYSYVPSLYQPFQIKDASSTFLRIYTETLLISLPTPDFSMPYNVICLACTVVALAFGPIHNITTKRITVVKQKTEDNMLSKIKKKMKKVFGQFSRSERSNGTKSDTKKNK